MRLDGMTRREVLDRTTTPDGKPLELALEDEDYVIRVGGDLLMSSALSGSEQEMARVAAEALKGRKAPRVLVGGLGMGFTLRAALDAFGADAQVRVAELLPAVIGYNRGLLAGLAGEPLRDPRARLFEGDVAGPLREGGWDAVLMDVDNGPGALTVASNAGLYGDAGAARMARALRPGGVVVVWSAGPSPAFERRLRRAGLRVEVKRVYARADARKGLRHTLFVGIAR